MSFYQKSKWRIFIVFSVALCLWYATTTASASVSAAIPEETASPPLPIGFHIDRADAAHLQAARQAGAGFVVYVMNWANIEPTPGYLYWEESDAALRAAEFYGLGVVARLDRPPAWAVDPDSPTPWSLDAYASFVHRVVERYGSRLDGVILWNEPNLRLEWNGAEPDPTAYVRLLRAGAEAARGVDPALPIFMAGLAFTQGGDGNLNDLAFLEGVYAAGGAQYFDGLALHPYGFGAPPTAPPAPDQLNVRRLELHRQIMVANGDGDKPAWITEMGWRVRAPDPADGWQVVTQAQQATYVQQAIALVASDYPWIERMAFWQLVAAGDRYGFDLWQGDGETSPAYAALVTACSRRPGCGASSPSEPVTDEARMSAVEILAPDVIVRLGDRGTLHPHWVHLHDNDNAAQGATLQWQGEFFLQPGLQQNDYVLLLETMQIDQPLNQLAINGISIGYLAPRSRPDPTSTWVTQRLPVKSALLKPGRNIMTIEAGPRNPAWQYDDWRWENLQVRHIRLTPTVDGTVAQAALPISAWQPLDSHVNGLGGWGDIIRLRPGTNSSFWVTGNRLGQIWRATHSPRPAQPDTDTPLTASAEEETWHLVDQAGTESQRRFNDVVEWNGYTLAATSEGLIYRTGDDTPWRAVRGAPTDNTVVVVAQAGVLYAGFSEQGLWRATEPAGPWQPVGRQQDTVLDLAGDGSGRLYVATPTGLYQVNLPTEGVTNAGITWHRLPPLPTAADTQLITRLYADAERGVVARAADRLWRWNGEMWVAYGPTEQAADLPISAVVACCGAGTIVGGSEVPLQQLTAASQWQLHPAADAFLAPVEIVDLLWVGETLVAGGTTGVFTWSPAGSGGMAGTWETVRGLPTTVSDLLIDPQNGDRWLAATPVGLYRSTDGGTTWSPITPPWTINSMSWGRDGRLFLARSRGLAWSADVAAANPGWTETVGYDRVRFFQVAPRPASDPTVPDQIWAGTWGNDIGVSRDGGRTMQGLGNGLETLSVLDIWWHATPGQLTIATIEGLYRSDNHGERWFQLPGPLRQQTIYALHQTEEGTLWAGAADGLWHSSDYGVTWHRATGVPPVTVLRMGSITASDGQPFLWIGTEADGWWLSKDQGRTWHFAGLEGRTVFAVVRRGQAAEAFVVATDKGLFETEGRKLGVGR